MRLILLWILNAVALLAVAWLLPNSIHVASFGSALLAALILGLVNALVRPVLLVLTLPVTLLTLGLFIFVLNGLMFWLAGSLIDGFVVAGFWPAVFGSMVYSVVSWALSGLLVSGKN
ncbi:MAG: phage holin family protein [Propionivibrio sp.]|nr:phage holin family protein [Propionivibrio sp.]MBK9028376.1 phage holin family protein [Propionivibrio sp.]